MVRYQNNNNTCIIFTCQLAFPRLDFLVCAHSHSCWPTDVRGVCSLFSGAPYPVVIISKNVSAQPSVYKIKWEKPDNGGQPIQLYRLSYRMVSTSIGSISSLLIQYLFQSSWGQHLQFRVQISARLHSISQDTYPTVLHSIWVKRGRCTGFFHTWERNLVSKYFWGRLKMFYYWSYRDSRCIFMAYGVT
jgi:hypothetical protein